MTERQRPSDPPAGAGELSLDLVHRVRPAVEAGARRTPMRECDAAGQQSGQCVWLKLECQQVTGSFKVRGPLAMRAVQIDARRWVTASAGNHGLGVAYAMRGLGRAPVVFVPRSSPEIKRRKIADLGAEVRVLETTSYDATEVEARRWAREHDALFVSPFDDDVIMAGNGGTLALEILEQLPELRSIVVPVGGGGLCSGVACVVRALAPKTRIVGVQSAATSAMYESLRRGSAITEHVGPPTLADGLEGGISERSFSYAQRWLDDVVLVSEDEIAHAMRWLWTQHELRVEGSGAVGMAAALSGTAELASPTCVILSGSNVDDVVWERVVRSL